MTVKRKTRQAYTQNALESHLISYYPSFSEYMLNTSHLNDMIMLLLDNEKSLYDAVTNTRRKPESVAWQAFMMLADDYINGEYIEPGTVFYASSKQLKDFLFKWGHGYEAIADSVDHVKMVREELRKEREREHVAVQV